MDFREKESRLIKLPENIAEKYDLEDKDEVVIDFQTEDGRKLLTNASFKLTSGKEFRIPKTFKEELMKYDKVRISLIGYEKAKVISKNSDV